jgi:predicted nuclease of predicted toxin-antitoxin system
VKVKLDENLPHRLVQTLTDLGHDVDTVREERIAGRDDGVVWDAAQAHARFLITQDLDFSDARQVRFPVRLLLVRLRQPGREALFSRVSLLFRTEDVESWKTAS